MKELVKKILKGSKLGRLIYEPLRKVYRLWAVPRRRRMLKKNGPQVLKDLAVIFKKHGIPAFAAYGTMLGFVRDHGFIAHDDDMDMGVLPGEWTPQRLLRVLLDEEKGFRVLFIFKFRDKVTEFKVEYKKILVCKYIDDMPWEETVTMKGYGEIAKELDLKKDYVKKFCKKYGIGGFPVEYKMNVTEAQRQGYACIFCGMPITQPRNALKKYCSIRRKVC